MPTHPHIILSDDKVKERVVIVGDIHGCLDEFKELLEKCAYDGQSSTLVLVGDLVNKGPYSAEVIQYVRSLNPAPYVVRYADLRLCVLASSIDRGNHDDFATSVALKLWPGARRDSYNYLDKLSQEDIEWLKELPYTISIPRFNALIVHAGLVPGVELVRQRPVDMHSMRNLVASIDEETGQRVYEGNSEGEIGQPWVELWPGPEHVFFGHDAKRGLQLAPFATGLDTGCCYGRHLTAVLLPSRELVSVQARRVYEPIKDKSSSNN